MRSQFEAVAWIPWQADARYLRSRDAVAVAWVRERCACERRQGVLKIHSHAHDWTSRTDAIGVFAREGSVVTNRGKGAPRGPTLVPDAYPHSLVARGMSQAQGSSLIVLEHPGVPLAAWAGALGAIDLSTGLATADRRKPEQVELLERVVSTAYNGWTSEPGRRSAQSTLPRLAASGMTWFEFLGYVLAIAPSRADTEALIKVAPKEWRAQASNRLEELSRPP